MFNSDDKEDIAKAVAQTATMREVLRLPEIILASKYSSNHEGVT